MGFPRLMTTDEMALHILGNFEWYHREVAFPPRLLPSDCEELCPNFVFAEAEEYARDYEVPELPQVVFLVMLLNGAVKVGVLRGWMIGVMESAIKELRWNTFQAWHLRRASRPPHLFPEDYRELYPSFTLPDEEEAAHDFNIREIVQATFYAMLLNDAVELGIVNRFMATDLKATLEGLRCGLLEAHFRQRTPLGGLVGRKRKNDSGREREREREDSSCFPTSSTPSRRRSMESSILRPSLLPENHHSLSPNFDLLVTMRYAHNFHISEITQAIIYAMVLNDVAELGLSSRIAMDYMISVLRELNWAVIESWLWGIEEKLRRAQFPYLVDLIANPTLAGGLEEDSRLSDVPSASSDKE
ncbi:hypothetical protein Cgig2_000861 [Carnegiea gigantea]|uniref:Uncharacterized protein n=1 Tax=Carnegiea gigantea TaxID=171969 RepID=A0A9Q1JZ73_9CARY|nr:hypothetical protein Cgig2_000861 [Carnegiea gigantea]